MPSSAIERRGDPLVIILITVACSCSFLLFGYDNGVFSGILINPWFLKTFNHPNPELLGTISALYNVGGAFGAILAFFFGNDLGRRKIIMIGTSVTAVGAIVQSAATGLAALSSGRIVCGIGVGTLTSTVGLWQGETVPAKTRGRYLTLQLLCGACLGVNLAQWINYGFHYTEQRVAFIFPLAFQLVFVVTCGGLAAYLPESPRWLVKRGQVDQAREVLVRLLGRKAAEESLAEIIQSNKLERRVQGNQYRQLFTNGPTQNFHRLCLCCGVMLMHIMNGVSSITFYMPTLLQTFVGASRSTSLLVAPFSSVLAAICALVPVLTIDRLGRRPFLYIGAAAQSTLLVIISTLLATSPPKGTEGGKTFGIAAIAMLFLYYGTNSATWLGPSWAYPAEILPLQIREKGLALGNVVYWMFQFMVVEITPIAIHNIGYKFYVILAVFNFTVAVVVYFFVPETMGLSLEALDFYFARKAGYSGEDLASTTTINDQLGRKGGKERGEAESNNEDSAITEKVG